MLGSVMNNRFATELLGRLPETVKQAIPTETLTAMAHNPQALINPEAQMQLQGMLGQPGMQGAALYEQLMQVLRQALATAMSEVFLLALAFTLAGVIVTIFLKEITLRKNL